MASGDDGVDSEGDGVVRRVNGVVEVWSGRSGGEGGVKESEYCSVKAHRLTLKDGCRVKEELFKADFEELFDISRKYALSIMKNKENQQFFHMQQQDPSSASMSGIDMALTYME
ncbi:hypothetical protein GWK47_034489 [Chionoecetes opilio]|uniref:Uncharacterized protein n=1 Tax=Chionoecetes opilio TaxID=41210 RepID=A0A8J5D2X6_CHIOP|nr:hypothetical protein GWK47_034489 [Chionoecetes opilio]